MHTTRQCLVSMALPAPTMASHHPGAGSSLLLATWLEWEKDGSTTTVRSAGSVCTPCSSTRTVTAGMWTPRVVVCPPGSVTSYTDVGRQPMDAGAGAGARTGGGRGACGRLRVGAHVCTRIAALATARLGVGGGGGGRCINAPAASQAPTPLPMRVASGLTSGAGPGSEALQRAHVHAERSRRSGNARARGGHGGIDSSQSGAV
jgi:hypothetical protein